MIMGRVDPILGAIRYDEYVARPAFVWRRMEPADLFGRCQKCVVFIGLREPQTGKFVPIGTGFLVIAESSQHTFQNIVTAAHVIDKVIGDCVYVRVNKIGGGSHVLETRKHHWLRLNEQRVINDVAVCPANIPVDIFDVHHIHLDEITASSNVPSVSLGEQVFLMGLFSSHYGEIHNTAVMRWARVAAIPDEPIQTGLGFMDGFLIEVQSIGGLSGSPLFARIGTRLDLPIIFAGMIQGHFLIENPEDNISPSGKPRSTGQINSGMAVVIPMHEVSKVIHLPELKAKREQLSAESFSKSKVQLDAASYSEPFVGMTPPSKEPNPDHREDFTSLLNAAAKTKPQGD